MKEARIHGRGGQGAVVAAELLAVAALEDGKYGQAFPAFGGERRGAPVQAFVRLSDRPIRLRHRVYEPHYIIILDRTLLDMLDVLVGLKPGGTVLIDSQMDPQEIRWTAGARVYTVPATRIALEVFGKPFVNPAMLGAFAAATGEISLAAIQKAFIHRFPGELGEKNSRAVQMGYDWIMGEGSRAVEVSKNHTIAAVTPWTGSAPLGAPGRPLHFAAVVAPRTSLAYPTGGWRYNRPVVDADTCNGCGICEMYCPDNCIQIQAKRAVVDYVYCKGCALCAQECATGAIRMVAEEQ